ncbi:MAG: L-histidine N(alpha)-methyltransferase [Acidobacteria bacterium]|nr:L-histidine N(alpha)-methyltransferase [Acidobacteriota bacterium]
MRVVRSSVSSRRSGTAPIGQPTRDFAREVREHLRRTPRQLPTSYLYDELGSTLFEAICRLPWYRIWRAEQALLARHAFPLRSLVRSCSSIAELGCGSGEKLAALMAGAIGGRAIDLHLVDVSATALALTASRFSGFPRVRVHRHQQVYTEGLSQIGLNRDAGRLLVLFLGSNVGNFHASEAEAFFRTVRRTSRPGDLFLLGADLVKPEKDLLLAYDDPLGLTAAFNKNLLVRVNRELGADFDVTGFAHRAVWRPDASRMEMHLVSARDQIVRIRAARLVLRVTDGEPIWTESSYKYKRRQIVTMVEPQGFARREQWMDEPARYALTLFEAR